MSVKDFVLQASRQADRENPERLRTNRNVDCFWHTTRVIQILRGLGLDASYVGKTNGEGQYQPSAGFPMQIGPYTITGVSHDAIWIAGMQFDLIGGGNDGPDPLGQPGTPTANEIPAQYHRSNNPPVPYPIGVVVAPPSVPAPAPQAPTALGRDEALDELRHLHQFYKDELKRPDGLWIGDAPDFEGIAAWYLDVYQASRFAGRSRERSRQAYVEAIRASDEWKAKHRP